jgi:hypothetical protein
MPADCHCDNFVDPKTSKQAVRISSSTRNPLITPVSGLHVLIPIRHAKLLEPQAATSHGNYISR